MAAILRVRDADGKVSDIPAIRGKSAYQYAVEGGYTGTEQEFSAKMAQESIPKNQGTENVGKILVVGTDGNLTLADLPEGGAGGDVVGVLDESNNILLSGNLADGMYTLKYENADGTYTEIGSLVVGEVVVPAYTNILTSGDYDIKLDQRWSNSNGGFTTGTGMISLVIPISDVLNKTIYFKGFTKAISANSKAPIWMVIKDNVKDSLLLSTDGTGNIWAATNLITVDETAGVYGLTINADNFPDASLSSVDGIAINMAVLASGSIGSTLPDGLIMTIDEEITG